MPAENYHKEKFSIYYSNSHERCRYLIVMGNELCGFTTPKAGKAEKKLGGDSCRTNECDMVLERLVRCTNRVLFFVSKKSEREFPIPKVRSNISGRTSVI